MPGAFVPPGRSVVVATVPLATIPPVRRSPAAPTFARAGPAARPMQRVESEPRNAAKLGASAGHWLCSARILRDPKLR